MIRYPCCGYLTVEDDYVEVIVDICPVCFWQHDETAHERPDDIIGPNHGLSLNKARENFKEIGACEQKFLSNVRLPFKDEF